MQHGSGQRGELYDEDTAEEKGNMPIRASSDSDVFEKKLMLTRVVVHRP